MDAVRMSPPISDYYDGSRIFHFVSDRTGLSLDQINFVVSQFVALALAPLFRTVLHPATTNPATRHGFGLIFGLVIGYFCFGMQAIHLAGLPAICYIVIRTQDPHIVQRLVLIVALVYLSCIHLHRQVYDYASISLDITGPLMVITQKVTSLAYNIHDGVTKGDADLTKNQLKYAVRKVPTALEYFSYVLHFQALMAGPVLFYADYIDFIHGRHLMQTTRSNSNLDNNSNSKEVFLEPSPCVVVFKKVNVALVCALIYVFLIPMFPISAVKDDDFLKKTSLQYKFWYLSMATMLVRFKYYHAWIFADAVCNNSGLGFNGYNADGTAKWDLISNVNMFEFECSTSLRNSIEAWNIGTNRWLRMVVYDRVYSHGTVLTYGLSALWHGFYPGYYLTFANGALFTLASRSMRRTIRKHFLATQKSKLFYDIMTGITTRFVMPYITFTFVLLELGASLRVYLHMYLCLHILALLALFAVPRMVQRVSDVKNLLCNSPAGAHIQEIARANGVCAHHND